MLTLFFIYQFRKRPPTLRLILQVLTGFAFSLCSLPYPALGGVSTSVQSSVKEVIVKKFSAYTESLHKRLETIDEKILAEINRSNDVVIDNVDDYRALRESIIRLRKEKLEVSARLDIVDRLRFQFISHYSNQDLKPFVQMRLSNLIRNELGVGHGLDLKAQDASLFLMDFKISVSRSPLAGLELIDFVITYLDQNSVLHPLPPAILKRNQAYSNDLRSEPAQNVSAEEAGDFVEQNASLGQNRMNVPLKSLLPEGSSIHD